jgi:uncharacterized protein
MAFLTEVTGNRIFMARLGHGADLLAEITALCKERDISLGQVSAIGAVKKACVGFYDQGKRVYEYITFDRPMEIANLTGNISIKDGAPFVHAHVTLADEKGAAFGGHLAPGTIIFAGEMIIESFDGPQLSRAFDQETGLALWKAG